MGDVSTRKVFVFDIPHPPSGHLPPPGEGKTKSASRYQRRTFSAAGRAR